MVKAPSGDSIGDPGAGPDAGLARLRFVLVEPSHVGNIGSCARAIRTMGFDRLCVVRPLNPQFHHASEAVALAAGASDVLERASVQESLTQALEGVQLAIATTGYAREFSPEPIDIRQAAGQAADLVHGSGAEVAFVFGTERAGLRNEDIRRCHLSCCIPADPVRASLNLAQAVQVVAYECRRELLARARHVDAPAPRSDQSAQAPRILEAPAGIEQTEARFDHLEQGLVALGYLDPAQPMHLMARLRHLLMRARPGATEVDILRGVASAMQLPRHLRAGSKKR